VQNKGFSYPFNDVQVGSFCEQWREHTVVDANYVLQHISYTPISHGLSFAILSCVTPEYALRGFPQETFSQERQSLFKSHRQSRWFTSIPIKNKVNSDPIYHIKQ
jgi:hypothetical protein